MIQLPLTFHQKVNFSRFEIKFPDFSVILENFFPGYFSDLVSSVATDGQEKPILINLQV